MTSPRPARRRPLPALALALALACGGAADPPTPASLAARLATLRADAGTQSGRALGVALEGVRRRPEAGNAWRRLGDALVQRARESRDPRDAELADASYREALARDPADADAWVGRAWVSGHRHEFARSRARAERALALAPDHPRAHALLGDAALAEGDTATAERHYQRMLDLRPGQAAYSRAAELLLATGDPAGAAALMRLAVRAGSPFPENTSWCRARLGEMLLAAGSADEALHVLETGLLEAPDSRDLGLAMARVQQAFRASAIGPGGSPATR